MQDQLPSDNSNAEAPKAEENATAAPSVTPEPPSLSSQESPTVTISPTEVSKLEVKVADAPADRTETVVTPVPEQLKVEAKIEEPEPLEPVVGVSDYQWQQVLQRVNSFLNVPTGFLGDFFEKYKQPLTSVGLILSAFVAVKLLSGLLDAVDDIPFVGPSLQLIGLGYTAWFVYRYLLGVKNREELSELIKSVREYVLGKGKSGN
ncbi:CAAD domain-containing protein [Argonema galeatum]|uniref:CAAD domain-containing protein n=1 Tax=Argonema galeatum TaxID=2942762 RepID=UPI0020122374|nr:CAAD domain-containing protein [Argonema galeatum]MCL1467195.1 hypothetical protein [Argonema galeatum A003/A1]